jgi:hypothetical protein
VLLDLWTNSESHGGEAYTTITTWRNKGKDIVYLGDTYYWTKDREFENFLDLPLRRNVAFELSTRVDHDTRSKLHRHRWCLSESVDISTDMVRYRKYIQDSRAEFTVARDQYVRPNTGWFSDRSACYLAAGRPVITQQTGFTDHYGNNGGLFAFKSLGEIAGAVREINADYRQQSRAARAVACEFFEAEKVLRELLDRAGV